MTFGLSGYLSYQGIYLIRVFILPGYLSCQAGSFAEGKEINISGISLSAASSTDSFVKSRKSCS